MKKAKEVIESNIQRYVDLRTEKLEEMKNIDPYQSFGYIVALVCSVQDLDIRIETLNNILSSIK